jgi:hypothetical protein
MKIVLTKEEIRETNEKVSVDPCAFIECSSISCELCPFHEAAVEFRRALDNFIKIVNSFDTEGE